MSTARRLLALAGGLAMGVAALQGSAVAAQTPAGLMSVSGAHHAPVKRFANGVANTTNDIIAGYLGSVGTTKSYIARFQLPVTGTCTSTDTGVAVISAVFDSTVSTSPLVGLVAFTGCQGGVAFSELDQYSADGTARIAPGTYLPGAVVTMKITNTATTTVLNYRNENAPTVVHTASGPKQNFDTFNLIDNRITYDPAGIVPALINNFGTQTPDGAKVGGINLGALSASQVTIYDMTTPTAGPICIKTNPGTPPTGPLFTWKHVPTTPC